MAEGPVGFQGVCLADPIVMIYDDPDIRAGVAEIAPEFQQFARGKLQVIGLDDQHTIDALRSRDPRLANRIRGAQADRAHHGLHATLALLAQNPRYRTILLRLEGVKFARSAGEDDAVDADADQFAQVAAECILIEGEVVRERRGRIGKNAAIGFSGKHAEIGSTGLGLVKAWRSPLRHAATSSLLLKSPGWRRPNEPSAWIYSRLTPAAKAAGFCPKTSVLQ